MPEEVPLDASGLAELRDAGRRRVGLCVVEAPSSYFDAVADAYTSAALVSASARANDGRRVTPTGGVWRVGEVEEQIIAPSDMAPVVCNVIVVDQADSMDAKVADRLLKTLEEPGAKTSFCLCVGDLNSLGPTILGRANEIIRLLVDSSFVKGKLSSGALAGDIDSIEVVWGSRMGFLLDAGDDDVAELAACGMMWGKGNGATNAAVAAAGLERIGLAVAGPDKASGKAWARRAVSILLSCWEERLGRCISEGAETKVAQEAQDGLLLARAAQAHNAPLVLVLSVALVSGDGLGL